ncbi:MAG: NAD-dependent epimerase/dehydratase family protein [Planctomycetota bacterium]|nr:NAD-dependent epimerase/dehydratase family protein [Planctomycetota bacterium]
MSLPTAATTPLRNAYDGQTVCVTGGAGFIGGHIVDHLVGLGARVRVIDDLSNSTSDHVLADERQARVRFVMGSILEDGALRDAVAGARVVFHLAAVGAVARSIENPARSWAVNATGTLRVLEAARAAGVRRVVYAASSSAYGDQPTLPKVETQMPKPRSPYAASKLAGEQLMAAWAASYGLSTISLRCFNVFGPRQNARSPYAAVVPAFASKVASGERPIIHGDGLQSRDFTPVDDAAYAMLLAGASNKPLAGEVVNVGTGRRTSLIELGRMIGERMGARTELEFEHRPAMEGDVRHSQADLARARELLGYEPLVTLEQGLDAACAWYRRSEAVA